MKVPFKYSLFHPCLHCSLWVIGRLQLRFATSDSKGDCSVQSALEDWYLREWSSFTRASNSVELARLCDSEKIGNLVIIINIFLHVSPGFVPRLLCKSNGIYRGFVTLGWGEIIMPHAKGNFRCFVASSFYLYLAL